MPTAAAPFFLRGLSPARARGISDGLSALAIFTAAFALRYVVLAERADDPFFIALGIDSRDYHEAALRLVGGEATTAPYFHPPLYVWFMSAVYWLLGASLVKVQFVQALIGAASCVLTFAIARRAFAAPGIAWIAAGIACCHGTLIYYDGQVLPGSLDVFLQLAALGALLAAGPQRGQVWLWIGGVFLALGAIHRGDALLMAPVALAWIWRLDREASPTPLSRRLRAFAPRALAIVAPVALAVGAVAFHNARFDEQPLPAAPRAAVAARDTSYAAGARRLLRGEFALVATNAGVNFYLGNHRATADRNDINHPEHFRHYDQLVKLPLAAGITSAAGRSRHLVNLTWTFIAEHPFAWLVGLGRKSLELVNGLELARNSNIYAHTQSSLVQQFTLWQFGLAFPNGLLIPLGLLGLCFARTRNGAGFLLVARLVTLAVFIVAFFVTARYRLPALPLLAIYAAAALTELWSLARGGAAHRRALIVRVTLLGGLVLLAQLPIVTRYDTPAEHEYQHLALACEEAGNGEGAYRIYTEALARDARSTFALVGLGTILRRAGQLDEAASHFERALAIDAESATAHNNFALIHLARGRFAECERHLQSALRLAPELPTVHSNLGALRAREGKNSLALEHFRDAVALDSHFADGHANIGILLEEIGDTLGAENAYTAALGAQPKHRIARERLDALRARGRP
ncbi:MAG: tetratricopeptide repeat protein [Planctomycetota bacterium]